MTDKLPRVTVAMLGARRHYAVPRLLYESGLLEHFYTDCYIGNRPWLSKILKAIPVSMRLRGVKRWLSRYDPVLPSDKVESFDAIGLWYVWLLYRTRDTADRESVYVRVAQSFNRRVVAKPFGDVDLIWAFNNAALELFQAAKAQGHRCILEQTILPKQLELRLLREEVKRWPDWEPGLQTLEANPLTREREELEWTLADCIVAGSEFVRVGLIECGVPEEKIRVVPYGVDAKRFSILLHEEVDSLRCNPLKILFAGQVGLRKGIPDLLSALKRFAAGEVQVRIAGSITLDHGKLEDVAGLDVQFLGQVPRSEMRSLFKWADVFVLPSIVEGSATVTYEALMSGLPVITTPNAGSIVQDGNDGFIVPAHDPEALAHAIQCYQQDRALLARHKSTLVNSRARVGLDRYRTDLERLVYDICKTVL